MTLRTRTLTAVAALTISAGFAVAQDTTATPTPADEPAEVQQSIEAPTTEAEPAVEEPATEEPAAEEPAAAEPVAEEPATEEAAPEATEETSAPAEPAAAEEAHAEDDHAAEEDHEAAGGGHGTPHIEDISFSFEGPFGTFDQFQLQRGLQVYTEVCAACHGLRYVPIRTLSDASGPGLPEDQVRAYAAELMPIVDAETGEERPRVPTDHFPRDRKSVV